ncbi:MAG: flagellar protein FlaG [Spirochaetes bacterium]|nr:flagellar protein FlaG [Spirochaetota bacterium]
MNIKSVTGEPIGAVGRYARKADAPEQDAAVQSSTRISPQSGKDLGAREISELVDRLNNGVRDIHERMSFSYHEKTQRIIVRVMNNDTNEVVREIPSKEAIRLLEHIQDFLGMLVDESR